MPNFKLVDYSPRFLAVDLSRQLIPGTFEYALHHLLDHQIDLSEIEARYCNDEVGASAYEPRILLIVEHGFEVCEIHLGLFCGRGLEAHLEPCSCARTHFAHEVTQCGLA